MAFMQKSRATNIACNTFLQTPMKILKYDKLRIRLCQTIGYQIPLDEVPYCGLRILTPQVPDLNEAQLYIF